MLIALVSPKPYATLVDKLGWVAEGFRAAGHETARVHDLAGVRAADEVCDVLLFDQKAAGLNRAELTSLALAPRRATWVQWWRDLIALEPRAPLAEQPFVRSFGGAMRAMDLVLVKERSLLGEFASLGIHAAWLDQACPEDMPSCAPAEHPEWDVLVLGSTAYERRRKDAAALVSAGFRVAWAGLPGREPVPAGVEWRPWRHPTRELPQLAGRAAIVLGVDCRSDVPGYTSDRSYLVAGMGACYIARVTDYGADSAPGAASPAADVAAWIYDDRESLIRVVRTALADPDERLRRGRRSRELVMSQHTYRRRAEQIVEMIRARTRVEAKTVGF